jgi:hypothetical protein
VSLPYSQCKLKTNTSKLTKTNPLLIGSFLLVYVWGKGEY